MSGSTLTYIDSVNAPTVTYSLSGLTPSATLKFRVRAYDSSGDGDSNTKDVLITTNSAPSTPSGITMTSPASSPSFNDTPTFSIAGVKSGDMIKLFTDVSCSTQVGTVVSTGTTASITTSSLAVGTFNFYATATGTNASACSTAQRATPEIYVQQDI